MHPVRRPRGGGPGNVLPAVPPDRRHRRRQPTGFAVSGPFCPACGAPVTQVHRVRGGIATALPCLCWLTPTQTQTLIDQQRNTQEPPR